MHQERFHHLETLFFVAFFNILGNVFSAITGYSYYINYRHHKATAANKKIPAASK